MYDSLSCVVNSNAQATSYGQLFSYVCGHDTDACNGIAANATTGDFGAYGMCNSTEQLSFVFDQYYKQQGSKSTACSFNGVAHVKNAQSPSGCSALVAQAGTAGTGTVTSSPTGTGAGAAASGGSAGASGSAASSSAGANMNPVPGPSGGFLPMAFIVAVALCSGAGMLLL